MLLKAHSMNNLKLVKSALACALLAMAAQVGATPLVSDAPGATASAPAGAALQNYGLENVSPAQLAEAQELGQSVVRDILGAYETKRTPEMEAYSQQTKRRVDAIADETMAGDRDKVLEFLGLDPASSTSLYFFVSWSMPLDMLRSIAIEAMWAGGTVVFRGVPPGKTLGEFITKDLQQLVYGKGAAANISVDPRLFDAYQVTTVPAIVFTTVTNDMQCQGLSPVDVKLENGQAASYYTCPPLDPGTYWRVTGAVTTNYALQAFIDAGAVPAQPYLNALSRGWAGKSAPGKEQRAFTGKWEDALSPSDKLAVQETRDSISRLPAAAP